MLYLLNNQERIRDAVNAILSAPIDSGWCVEVKEYKRTRTQAQNATLHMWLTDICNHWNETQGEKRTPLTLKDECKAEYLPIKTRVIRGKTLVELTSTSELNVEEFAEFLNKIYALGQKLGAKMRNPDDIKYAMYGVNPCVNKSND